MKTFVCIDDTDNLGSRGTGALASLMIEYIEEKKWGKCSYITRHQLYFHPDIPYTSHNSTMCFVIEHEKNIYNSLKECAIDFLTRESAEGSDPGLCIVKIEKLKDVELLKNYGKKAKKEILTKEFAYETAKKLGVHLSEHGGTGGGVIGALAGIGLRLTGNDGRVKGKEYFPLHGERLTIRQILDNSNIDKVQGLEGEELSEDTIIKLGEKVKAVFLNYQKVLLVYPVWDEDTELYVWNTCIKEQLRVY